MWLYASGRGHKQLKMEVCVDSLASALNASKGGATRLELCSNLSLGGTTPTVGLLKMVKRRIPDIPVFAMIRPRHGDFCYSEEEMAVMMEDMQSLKAEGVDGFVFGVLTPEGAIDRAKCERLLSLSRPLPVTFHRAFDLSVEEPGVLLETLISLGFTRLLTSGRSNTALEGVPLIRDLIQRANGEILIMPGAGIRQDNIQTILRQSRAIEFHGSASRGQMSLMKHRNEAVRMGSGTTDEYCVAVTDDSLVAELIRLANEVWEQK